MPVLRVECVYFHSPSWYHRWRMSWGKNWQLWIGPVQALVCHWCFFRYSLPGLPQSILLCVNVPCILQLSDDREQKPEQQRPSLTAESTLFQNHTVIASSSPTVAMSRTSTTINSNSIVNAVHANSQKLGPPYSVVNIDSSLGLSNPTSRKICEAYDDPKDVSFDHDENKYQRKSAIEWFLRWWKLISRAPVRRKTAGSLYKRYAVMALIGIFLFVGIILLFSWLGRMATDGDPSFDVLANPNLKFGEKSVI